MRETADEDQILKSAARILSGRLQLMVAEMAQIQSAIDCIKQEIGKTTHLNSQPAGFKNDEDLRIRRDVFLGMRLSTAVQECLKMRNEAMHAHEILRLLEGGGFATESLGSVENMQLAKLANTLRKNTKTYHRLPNGAFGLLVWYRNILTGTTRHKRPKEEA